jgi:hypothetical protein
MQNLRPLERLQKQENYFPPTETAEHDSERMIFLRYMEYAYPEHLLCYDCASFHKRKIWSAAPRFPRRINRTPSSKVSSPNCVNWKKGVLVLEFEQHVQ